MAVLAFVTVYTFGFDDSVYDEEDENGEKLQPAPAAHGDLEVRIPGKGEFVSQADIADKTFAAGTLGPCFGMRPESNSIKAPVSGTVTMT